MRKQLTNGQVTTAVPTQAEICLLNADTQMADIPHFHSGVVYAVPCSESTSSAVLLLLWLAAAKTARCAHFTHVCWPKTA